MQHNENAAPKVHRPTDDRFAPDPVDDGQAFGAVACARANDRTNMNSTQSLERHIANMLTVLAVSQWGSMTVAARTILKAPSAVWRSVNELEHAMGALVFERSSRGVRPTVQGKAVVPRAARICDEIDLAVAAIIESQPKGHQLSSHRGRSALSSARNLRLLIDICELRSIGAAAQRGNISQAGASMALARMEAALGVALFVRGKGTITPTPLSEFVATCAQRILAELRHLESDLLSLNGTLGGFMVVGATHLARSDVFPAAFATLVAQHPHIRVRTVEGSYKQLLGQLRTGEIDILFGVLRPEDLGRELTGQSLYIDRMSVLCGSGHRLTNQARLELGDLVNEKWILPRPNSIGLDQVEACFRRHGLPVPRASIETGDLATLRRLLDGRDLIAIASPRQLDFEIRHGLVQELPVDLDGPGVELGYIVRAKAQLPKAGLALIDQIHALAAL